jgi:hypothetical protein
MLQKLLPCFGSIFMSFETTSLPMYLLAWSKTVLPLPNKQKMTQINHVLDKDSRDTGHCGHFSGHDTIPIKVGLWSPSLLDVPSPSYQAAGAHGPSLTL